MAGLSALWLLDPIPGAITPDTLLPLFLAAALGALLPDLDAGQSQIKSLSVGGIRPFAPLSVLVSRTFGHRGLLHSGAGLALMGLLALPLALWWGWTLSAALWLGYASHLALDACTRTGLPRSPLKRGDARRFHLLPPRLRIVTGSPEEDMLLPLFALALLWLLFRHFPPLR